MEQPAGQRFTRSDNQLERFRRLDEPDDSRQNAEHARFGTAWRGAGRRRLRKKTAVTGAAKMWRKNAGLSFETKDRAIDVRFAREDADVVREIAGGKIIRAVDHDIVIRDDLRRVLARQPR